MDEQSDTPADGASSHDDRTESIDLSAPEGDIKAYFERTATPTQRIGLWLDQIEETANAVQAGIDQSREERQRAAGAALQRYEAVRSRKPPTDSDELSDAATAYCDAANAVRPPLWTLAREALINAKLVREDLARGVGDEAVEAALRAVNAWWRMRTVQFEKPIRYGFEGLEARSQGGKKRAVHVAQENAARDAKICQTYRNILAERSYSRADAIKLLSDSFRLTTKQIRRIVPPKDVC